MGPRRDLRSYARSTMARLIVGGLALVFLIGDGLVYFVYGRQAAAAAVLCTGLGLAPIALIWLFLLSLEWLARKGGRD